MFTKITSISTWYIYLCICFIIINILLQLFIQYYNSIIVVLIKKKKEVLLVAILLDLVVVPSIISNCTEKIKNLTTAYTIITRLIHSSDN